MKNPNVLAYTSLTFTILLSNYPTIQSLVIKKYILFICIWIFWIKIKII